MNKYLVHTSLFLTCTNTMLTVCINVRCPLYWWQIFKPQIIVCIKAKNVNASKRYKKEKLRMNIKKKCFIVAIFMSYLCFKFDRWYHTCVKKIMQTCDDKKDFTMLFYLRITQIPGWFQHAQFNWQNYSPV